jgi:hypothetical protein
MGRKPVLLLRERGYSQHLVWLHSWPENGQNVYKVSTKQAGN